MPTPEEPRSDASQAASVAAPQVGFVDASVDTTGAKVDLKQWAGKYVEVQVSGDAEVFFGEDGDGFAYAVGAAADQSAGTLGVPFDAYSGQHNPLGIVPVTRSTLHYRAKSGTVSLKVFPRG